MKSKIGILLVALGLGLLVLAPIRAEAQDDNTYVALVSIDGVIDGVSARYLSRGIRQASGDGATLVVVTLDTPG